MAGAITKLSIDVLSPVKRPGFPGSTPRNNAYAHVAKSLHEDAAFGSAVPTTGKSLNAGQKSAASSSMTKSASAEKISSTSSAPAARPEDLDPDGSEVIVTDNGGDTLIVVNGKLMPRGDVGAEADAELARQTDKSASDATLLDQRRNTSAEPSLRGSAEGKFTTSDGSMMVKLLSAEMQSLDTRSAPSSINDASPLTPLGQSPNAIAAKSAAGLVELALPTRLGEPGWQEGLSGRVSMMVNQRIGVATIRMNPPELGPIEVKINLNHDRASVQFVSHAVQVRDALEQSIPRLREMLEDAGFTLVDSQVSDQPQQQQQEQQKAHAQGDAAAAASELAAQTITHQAVGLIDYYA